MVLGEHPDASRRDRYHAYVRGPVRASTGKRREVPPASETRANVGNHAVTRRRRFPLPSS